LKEIIEEYGGIVLGVLIGVVSLVIIGTIVYQSVLGFISHVSTVLYG